jgi:hypothetical protein
MFTATWYFLGLAGFLATALACFARGKQAGRRVEIDFTDLRAASLCIASAGSKRTWRAVRMKWTAWYLHCHEMALRKQKTLYSWARTLAMCSALCMIGVCLEAQYDKRISPSTVLAGLVHPAPAAAAHP